MADRVSLLYSTQSGAIPDATQLMTGELAVNIVDGKLYTKDTGSNIILLSGGGGGGVAGGTQVSAAYAATASAASSFVIGSDPGSLAQLRVQQTIFASGGIILPFNIPYYGTEAGIARRIFLQAGNTYFGAIDLGWQPGGTYICSDNSVILFISGTLSLIATPNLVTIPTGSLQLGTAAQSSGSNLYFQGASGFYKGITWLGNDGTSRWAQYTSNNVEGIGNTGMDMQFFAYTNSGSFIDSPIGIQRWATGSIYIGGSGLRNVIIGPDPNLGSAMLRVSGSMAIAGPTSLYQTLVVSGNMSIGNNLFVSGTVIGISSGSTVLSSSLLFPTNAGIQTIDSGAPRRIVTHTGNTYFGAIDRGWQTGNTYLISENSLILQVSGTAVIQSSAPSPSSFLTVITGSLLVSGTQNNAGFAISASAFSGSGTNIIGVVSASYANSASYALSSSNIVSITSASYAATASLLLGSIQTASYAIVAQNVLGSITSASYANTASAANNFFVSGSETIIGNVLINNFTASKVDVTITGSISQTGSIVIIGNISASGFSGSIQSSSFASYSYTALTASNATTASYALVAQNSITSSYAGTASLLLGSIVSSSYALTSSNTITASYALNAGNSTSSVGKHTIWMPASAMFPRLISGSAAIAQIQLDTPGTGSNHISLDFAASTIQYAQFYVAFPRSWDESSLTARFYWSHVSSSVNFNVIWGIHALPILNSGSMTGRFGVGTEVTSSGGIQNTLYVTSETPNINVGSPDDNSMMAFELYRSASGGTTADKLSANARLLGLQLLYTTDASVDN